MTNSYQILENDHDFVWHPYSAMGSDLPVFPVKSAHGVRIKLMDGRELIDGMSSWWSAIHGYNHPVMNQALFRLIVWPNQLRADESTLQT